MHWDFEFVTTIIFLLFSGHYIKRQPFKDMSRALLLLFLSLAHSAWLFFYIYLPEESWLSLLSFISVSIYLHSGAFLLGVICMEIVGAKVFPNWKHPLVRSKGFHTAMAFVAAAMFTTAGV